MNSGLVVLESVPARKASCKTQANSPRVVGTVLQPMTMAASSCWRSGGFTAPAGAEIPNGLYLHHFKYKSNAKSRGHPMRIISYSEARSSLKSVLDAVQDDADVTVISRRDGADAVVMSFDYYQSIMETMHLLASPANAAHLATSIAQHKAGKAVRRALAKT